MRQQFAIPTLHIGRLQHPLRCRLNGALQGIRKFIMAVRWHTCTITYCVILLSQAVLLCKHLLCYYVISEVTISAHDFLFRRL